MMRPLLTVIQGGGESMPSERAPLRLVHAINETSGRYPVAADEFVRRAKLVLVGSEPSQWMSGS